MPPTTLNYHKQSKRRHDHEHGPTALNPFAARPQLKIPPQACVQAYEAQLIYGKEDYARSIGTPRITPSTSASNSASGSGSGMGSVSGPGVGLIRWAGEREDGDDEEMWLDRHDILHLLPSIPDASHVASLDQPGSPAGSSTSSWDSLPSDLEDKFFLSGSEEEEEYEAGKRRKWLETRREERIREREREERERDAAEGIRDGDSRWEGEDEVPPPTILTLMQHTAKSMSTSPNPKLLEIRILTHHASDERFTFLRGRYKKAWEKVKMETRLGGDPGSGGKGTNESAVIGSLMGGYESSENEDDDEGQQDAAEPEDTPPPPPPPPSPPPSQPLDDSQPEIEAMKGKTDDEDEEEKKRQRRFRAEEWKKKRAEGKT